MFDSVRLDVIDRSLAEIRGQAAWMLRELDQRPPSGSQKAYAQVREVVTKLHDTATYDVATEVLNLRDKLGRGIPGQPHDPDIVNPDPFVTAGFIDRWLGEDVQRAGALVQSLQEQGSAPDLQAILMTGMTPVLQAFIRIQDEIQPILAAGPEGYRR
jgi:hypothetical protein